jgi:HAD superfamily hydrolase (TIGR01509 family)
MSFSLPEGNFEGYIFDCDGTLADSMPVHFEAWTQALKDRGARFEFTEAMFYEWGGVPAREIVMRFNDLFGAGMDPQEMADYKESLYEKFLDRVEPIPDVVALARRVVSSAKIAVASGGVLPIVNRTLDIIGVGGLFSVVVTAEQVARGKPAPDMFLLAAERMGVAPSRCVVLEDSPTGIAAAEAAGMAWSLVTWQHRHRPEGAPPR